MEQGHHRMYRPSIPTNATRSSHVADWFDRDDAPPLGPRRVFTQACHDLYGTKDVQDAITASYVWMADQIGHLTLGLVPTLIFCWIIAAFSPQNTWRILWFIIAGVVVFSYWIYKEVTDYADTKKRSGHCFRFDSADIFWNVETALFYFALGGILAVTAFINPWSTAVALALLLYPALRIALWWLRRKLAFQQAGLPYLYRLANFVGDINQTTIKTINEIAQIKNTSVAWWHVLFGGDKIKSGIIPEFRHLLITGPLGAGKTSLAVGIGTEFAFSLGISRYLSAAKLVQLVVDAESPTGEMDYDDGRILWPWRECDLVIIDDVDAGAAGGKEQTVAAEHLVQPKDLVQVLTAGVSAAPLSWLAERRSVWVLGDPTGTIAWRGAIAGLIGIAEKAIMIVPLTHPLTSKKDDGTGRDRPFLQGLEALKYERKET